MYTCKTCALLKRSKRKLHIKGDVVLLGANSVRDALTEWYCPYFWWSSGHPPKGTGCGHWVKFNGKHWLS